MSLDYLHLINDKIKTFCRGKNIENYSVTISQSDGLSVSIREQEADVIEHNNDNALIICIYRGQKKGIATTTNLSQSSIELAIEKARYIAKWTQDDKYAGLPDSEDFATKFIDLDTYYDDKINVDKMINAACITEKAGLDVAGISCAESVDIDSSFSTTMLSNSLGFTGYARSSHYGLSATMIAAKNGDKQRDGEYSIHRKFKSLDDAKTIGIKASKKTLSRLNPVKIKTGKYPIVLDAQVAKGLFGTFISAISGSNLYNKNSFLLDSLDKKIFSKQINIQQKPFVRGLWGSVNFDNEGVAPQNTQIIKNGVLQSYLLSSYSARRLGLKTTGNAGGVHNLFIEHNNKLPQKQLLKNMDKGLFITETIGMGVNLLTGDYSKGATGFWVENGKICYPISEFTIADNLNNIYNNIIAVGNDIDYRGNILTGSIFIKEMMIAGT